MADKTLSDIGRRELDFTGNLISEALPEWFREDNPKLITLLEKYHENLDSDGNFGQRLKTIPTLRDIAQTDTENLTFIEDELLLGQNYFKGTLDARTSASLSNNFYRSKGTKFGIERFFNMFFGEIPDIVYGKDLTFQIGSDEIGPGTEKRITDATIYQFWGILIKFGRSTNEWLDLYKLFAHPAGMFVGAEIAIETKNADISFDQMPDKGIDESPDPQFVGLASAAPFARQNLSGIIGKLRTPYNVDPANPTQTGWPADSDGITWQSRQVRLQLILDCHLKLLLITVQLLHLLHLQSIKVLLQLLHQLILITVHSRLINSHHLVILTILIIALLMLLECLAQQ